MINTSHPHRLQKLLSRFAGDRDGNIALIFAICIVPIMGFVGAAIDYSRAAQARTEMQGSLDSAALMVAKDAAGTTFTDAELTRRAQSYFDALFPAKLVQQVVITATLTRNAATGDRLKLDSQAQMNTQLMKMVGYPQLPVVAASVASWGGSRMRVAIALDVTGSMDKDGKLKAMKEAATDLIDTLHKSAKTAEDVHISIVPFATMVNVGNTNKNALWLKWDLFDAIFPAANNILCSILGCDPREKWSGCLADRDEPADTTRAAATSNSTRFPATGYIQYADRNDKVGKDTCVPPIVPMTSAYDANKVKDVLKKSITDLTASGGTNQPIGIAWAWLTLQADGPLSTPAKEANRKYTDVIIVLSDGMNTGSRKYGNGTTYDPRIDKRQKLLCQNIKDTGTPANPIMIFTIQVNTTGDPESTVLKECADSPSAFFQTSTADGIALAFEKISQSLTKLRLAE